MASSSASSSPPDAAASWSDLPGDALGTIASLLPSFVDLLRFRSVCRSWRDAAAATASPPLPYLMFSDKADGLTRRFYSLSDGRTHLTKLPEAARQWRCCGSSPDGWLAMVGLDASVRLLNPLSGAHTDLPPLTTLPEVLRAVTGPETDHGDVHIDDPDPPDYSYPWYVIVSNEGYTFRFPAEYIRDDFVQKAVASPVTAAGCTVMVLYHDYRVAYARPGDETWTSFWHEDWNCPWFEDLVCHETTFYLLTWQGAVREVHLDGAGRPVGIEDCTPENGCSVLHSGHLNYLSVAQPSGEILLVSRHLRYGEESCSVRTEWFEVWKMEVDSGGGCQWVPAEGLGGCTLFLACSDSVACALPGGQRGCAPDCIYFLADNMDFRFQEGALEMGIYHMKDRTIERLSPPDCDEIEQHPIWISPSM